MLVSTVNKNLYKGENITLTCTVNTFGVIDTPIYVTISWFGPSGPITSDSEYTVSPQATQLNNTPKYNSTLLIKSLSVTRDNGEYYICIATLMPCQVYNNNSDGHNLQGIANTFAFDSAVFLKS